MKDSIFHKHDLITPAYVYDEAVMVNVFESLAELKEKTGCLPLYSIKSASILGLLELIKPYVSGFSCSSLYEARLAKELLDEEQTIHITTPGYREEEWQAIIGLCDFISLNSVSQWQRYAKKINTQSSCGIRINPELSFVSDERYDPCRPDSKLGMTFEQIANAKEVLDWELIQGIQIHNNCESNRFEELKQSIKKVTVSLDEYKPKLNWINLGGGYLFNNETNIEPLEDTIKRLQDKFDVDVYIEPGKGVTGQAGSLVASVIDLIETKNKTIAVLDTTVNHLPEVFEYQYQPKVKHANETGQYQYRLAGASCLSGDLFGDYCFNEPLKIDNRIVFENVGAYMQVKANMFNGINLPATYLLDRNNELKLLKQHDYESYRDRL